GPRPEWRGVADRLVARGARRRWERGDVERRGAQAPEPRGVLPRELVLPEPAEVRVPEASVEPQRDDAVADDVRVRPDASRHDPREVVEVVREQPRLAHRL